MASKQLVDYVENGKNLIKTYGLLEEYVKALTDALRTAFEIEKDREYAISLGDWLKTTINNKIIEQAGGDFWALEKYCFAHNDNYKILEWYYGVLLVEAQNRVFDSYLQYLEKNRLPEERFYMPKRKQFLKIGLVQGFQSVLDDKLDILSVSMPPGTGKTTIEKFFHSGVMGWFPNDYNLFFSHSSDITRMYYDGVLAMVTDTINYAWADIFPDLQVTGTNAKMMQINIGKYKPFQNLMTASVGSEMAGKVRANRFLFVDDMIGKVEEALNKNTLDKLWNIYSTDARQRKMPGCKEIIIATRWSVHDAIGRLERAYEGDERAKFIAIPDIDPETEESNFDFEYDGMSKKFFQEQEKLMDEISYKCLYKNQPVEREGLLYHDDDLRRYIDMPMKEPDAIIGVCDTKSKGTDFLVLPVMYQYDDDYYMADCICTNSSDYGVQYQRMANLILEHNMQQVEFESNAGGDRVAFEVDKLVKDGKGRCSITTKPTETNKETRIIVNADWIKKHCLFKDKELYTPKSDYGVFMNWLLSYSIAGKNIHDDIPDALANFALFVTKKDKVTRISRIIQGGMF